MHDDAAAFPDARAAEVQHRLVEVWDRVTRAVAERLDNQRLMPWQHRRDGGGLRWFRVDLSRASCAGIEYVPGLIGTRRSPLRLVISEKTPDYRILKIALEESSFNDRLTPTAEGLQMDLPYQAAGPADSVVRQAVAMTVAMKNELFPRIDVGFNMESDAGGRDPDKYSPTLRRYHRLLWSKPLPDGTLFKLEPDGRHSYLRLEGHGPTQHLASDSITHSYRRSYTNRIGDVIAQVDPALVARVFNAGSTIGGYILYPSTVRDGKPTINGARGMNWRIADRFDLTLECIRRHYEGGVSPLTEALARYADFFDLFGGFTGYVDFFLLQDLTGPCGGVSFYLPFDDFQRSPLPTSVAEYETYAQGVLGFLSARNRRIQEWAEANLGRWPAPRPVAGAR